MSKRGRDTIFCVSLLNDSYPNTVGNQRSALTTRRKILRLYRTTQLQVFTASQEAYHLIALSYLSYACARLSFPINCCSTIMTPCFDKRKLVQACLLFTYCSYRIAQPYCVCWGHFRAQRYRHSQLILSSWWLYIHSPGFLTASTLPNLFSCLHLYSPTSAWCRTRGSRLLN